MATFTVLIFEKILFVLNFANVTKMLQKKARIFELSKTTYYLLLLNPCNKREDPSNFTLLITKNDDKLTISINQL